MGHTVIFCPSSVIIPFPPNERKDWNNPGEIYGSPGGKPFVSEQVENKTAVAERDTAWSPVSPLHRAQPTVTDTAHYTDRLYGVRLKSLECELLSTYDLQGK